MKVFTWWQASLLALFGGLMIVFSVVNFNALIHPDDGLQILNWKRDEDFGVEYWRRVIMVTSGIASFTGALCVVLVARGKLSNYFWGIINCVFYGVYAFAYGYAGDAQLNIFFFLPFQFAGTYTWNRNLDLEQTARARTMKWYQWLGTSVVVVGLSFGLYYEIPLFARWISGVYYFEDLEVPRRLEATSISLSIMAQVLMTYRFWEQWLLWITINCIQIAMYSGVAGFGVDFNIVAMWTLFQANALMGLYQWVVRWWRERSEPKVADRAVAETVTVTTV